MVERALSFPEATEQEENHAYRLWDVQAGAAQAWDEQKHIGATVPSPCCAALTHDAACKQLQKFTEDLGKANESFLLQVDLSVPTTSPQTTAHSPAALLTVEEPPKFRCASCEWHERYFRAYNFRLSIIVRHFHLCYIWG